MPLNQESNMEEIFQCKFVPPFVVTSHHSIKEVCEDMYGDGIMPVVGLDDHPILTEYKKKYPKAKFNLIIFPVIYDNFYQV